MWESSGSRLSGMMWDIIPRNDKTIIWKIERDLIGIRSLLLGLISVERMSDNLPVLQKSTSAWMSI